MDEKLFTDLIFVLLWIGWVIIVGVIAKWRKRKVWGWVIGAMFFSPIIMMAGLMIVEGIKYSRQTLSSKKMYNE